MAFVSVSYPINYFAGASAVSGLLNLISSVSLLYSVFEGRRHSVCCNSIVYVVFSNAVSGKIKVFASWYAPCHARVWEAVNLPKIHITYNFCVAAAYALLP